MYVKREDQTKIGLSCQVDSEVLLALKEISESHRGYKVSPTTVAKIFIEERLGLYRSGLKLNDLGSLDVLNRVISQPSLFEAIRVLAKMEPEQIDIVMRGISMAIRQTK